MRKILSKYNTHLALLLIGSGPPFTLYKVALDKLSVHPKILGVLVSETTESQHVEPPIIHLDCRQSVDAEVGKYLLQVGQLCFEKSDELFTAERSLGGVGQQCRRLLFEVFNLSLLETSKRAKVAFEDTESNKPSRRHLWEESL
jgi:hypothetical protein